ncbi:uncharacterized protein isoform X6 [Danio rerio]|uniref:Uncharacterized protein isoform X6 n=1 Tax=Danio rerio TaxID=7955 RepID=A0AC58I0H6_DANRE
MADLLTHSVQNTTLGEKRLNPKPEKKQRNRGSNERNTSRRRSWNAWKERSNTEKSVRSSSYWCDKPITNELCVLGRSTGH